MRIDTLLLRYVCVGPSTFNSSTSVAVDVRLEDHGSYTLQTEGSSNIGLVLDTNGTFKLVDGKKTVASGAADFEVLPP